MHAVFCVVLSSVAVSLKSGDMIKTVQSIIVGIKTALIEMRTHKLRSSLSMLGVMLGVASLVAMLTLIGGIDVFLNKRMAKWAGSVWFWEKPEPEDEEKIEWSRSPGLRFSDGVYLEKHVDAAGHFYRKIERRRSHIIIEGKKERARIAGMDSVTIADELEHVRIRKGRMFSPQNYRSGDAVCLISWQIEERIQRQMGIAEPDSDLFIGDFVRHGNVQLRIIGVFYPRDDDFRPWHLRRAVIMPLRTMQRYMSGMDPHPGNIQMQVADAEKIQQQSKQIAMELIIRHRGVEDFEYRTADWLEEITRMLNNVTVLMSIISVISLLVGGMSIMNVMLSSITERIHEIGVRKALGAKNLQVFIQFLAESATLCVVGGSAGCFLGMIPIAFNEAIRRSTDGAVEPTILPLHFTFVFSVIVFVGILFGLYPAFKAGKMNPVEALRYE